MTRPECQTWELTEPLPVSPYLTAADQLIAARFWPLDERTLMALECESVSIGAFDTTDVLHGIAIMLPDRRRPQSDSTDEALLAYLTSDGEPGNPLDLQLLAASEEVALRRGKAALWTVGIKIERSWLEKSGFTLAQAGTSFMTKRLIETGPI